MEKKNNLLVSAAVAGMFAASWTLAKADSHEGAKKLDVSKKECKQLKKEGKAKWKKGSCLAVSCGGDSHSCEAKANSCKGEKANSCKANSCKGEKANSCKANSCKGEKANSCKANSCKGEKANSCKANSCKGEKATNGCGANGCGK